MRIYVASFFNTRDRIIPYVAQLANQGHIITSSWLIEPPKAANIVDTGTHLYTHAELQKFAIRDVEELKTSQIIIMDTIDVTPRGGREVEWGSFVFGVVPRGYIVGPMRNVFHELATACFETWEECVEYFGGLIF